MKNEKITPNIEATLKEVRKLKGDELGRFLDIISIEYFGIDRNKNLQRDLELEEQYLHDM